MNMYMHQKEDANTILLKDHDYDMDEDSKVEFREEDISIHEKWAAIKRLKEMYGFAY